MNRLVLIGNGFDIAHGLKTRYADFISWYWSDMGYRLLHGNSNIVSDELCSFTLNDDIKAPNWSSAFQGWYYKREKPWIPWDVNEVVKLAKENTQLCEFKYNGEFFERINKSIEAKGWVDIEREYYTLLVLLYSSVEGNYRNLNTKLECLRDKLIDYLKVESKNECAMIESIKEKIYCPIQEREIAVSSRDILHDNGFAPTSIMLLNFNYTKTPEVYASNYQNVTLNYIHGNLDNPNSVIFGYGDDLDKDYQKLREQNDNEGLTNIKSIKYLEADNYRKMLAFIESAPFQVVIMGHSCGNSDRTLLNTLFEHKNCVSIKPYFYIKDDGSNNYLELIQNISRNFTDMKLMRDRVVNKTFTEPLI